MLNNTSNLTQTGAVNVEARLDKSPQTVSVVEKFGLNCGIKSRAFVTTASDSELL